MRELIDVRETGHRIKMLCAESGISVSKLQDALNLNNPQSIYKWLRGETLPTVEHLFVLAEVIDQPVEEIIVLKNRTMSEKRVADLIRWAGRKARNSPKLRKAFYDALAALILGE